MSTIPTLALIPSGVKASKVYSVLPTDGTGDFTFSRAGALPSYNATRVNSEGLIEEVLSNVPRLNYPMIDGVVQGCPILLLEPERRNIALYSEQFDNAAWNKEPATTTITANNAVSPDGTQNADLFGSSLPSAQSGLYQTILGLTPAATYYISAYVKLGTATNVCITVNNTIAWNTVAGQSFSIADGLNTNTWIRVGFSFTAPAGANINYHIGQHQQSGVDPQSVGTFFVWGAQLEQGSYPTSYIPTSGSTVTRVGETANGAGDANTFNDSEGVLMIETAALSDSSNFRNFSLSDGSTSNLISFIFTNTNVIRIDFTNQAQLFDLTTDIKNNNKILVSYKLNEVKLYVNGFLIAIDTNATMPTGLNTLRFDNTIGEPLYSKTKQIQYFDTALNDSDLETLTSWTSFTEMATGQLYTIE